MCSMTAQEVMSHYNSNKTKVFTVMLDASKAFDRVNYINLFEKTFEKGNVSTCDETPVTDLFRSKTVCEVE